ncbi:MAG: fused response regulator/phosphatase [Alphaproteobacteria bacterium]|nr:fused response regulator/phosphatase [Alphaproteobacteria bacterium]
MTVGGSGNGGISLSGCRVLVVDDNKGSRMLLGALVSEVGVGHVEFAADGEAALAVVEIFQPDLVLLDVRMPRLDGFEVCRRLRSNPSHADLPVLIQTALTGDDSRADSFRAGATDMVSKPVVPFELMARVRIHLEKVMLIRDLRQYHERVAQELTSARVMQQGLLPPASRTEALALRHNLVIASHFEASSELGGDIWDIFEIDDHRLGLFICDFSGHGVTAALNTFRLHTLARQIPPGNTPSQWLAAINATLKPLLPPGQFATMLYAIIDTAADTLTYASAGAPSPVVGDASTSLLLDSMGMFLGVSESATYVNHEVSLAAGGFVFLYSDALTESLASDGSYLGDAGLLDLVRDSARVEPQGRLDAVLERFFDYVLRPLTDDLTAVWISRR